MMAKEGKKVKKKAHSIGGKGNWKKNMINFNPKYSSNWIKCKRAEYSKNWDFIKSKTTCCL